jgi:formylglycine-generating enzyme required for sulfatase activity
LGLRKGRNVKRIVFLLITVILVSGCSGQSGEPQETHSSIRVKSNPTDAKILVDGSELATTNGVIRYLQPGRQDVEVKKDGYKDWTRNVSVEAGEEIELAVRLEENKPKTLTDSSVGMEFVLVNGSCYGMGDTFGDGHDTEKPVHEVCVEDYYIGKTEVTQGQWEDVMGNNPSKFQQGKNYPVESVSWDDVQGFMKKLNNKTGKNYRLPTEAEWEYAARSGGREEKYAGTSNVSELNNYAWYGGDHGDGHNPVGRKRANGLGLYDMSGNVWEWVQDIYSKGAYRKHQRNNPIYTENGSSRVYRGGSWYDYPRGVRASYRGFNTPDVRNYGIGFRLVWIP